MLNAICINIINYEVIKKGASRHPATQKAKWFKGTKSKMSKKGTDSAIFNKI